MRDNLLLTLFVIIAPLSFLTIGGGQSVLPEIHRQMVGVHGFISEANFIADFAITQMAPGPKSLIITLIGWQTAGWQGALVTTLAIFVPSSLLVFALAHIWSRYRGARWQLAVEQGLAPIAAGLILASSLTLLRAASGGWVGWAVSAAATAVMLVTQFNPLLLVGAGAAIFLLLGG